MISRYRPTQSILAFTPNKKTYNQTLMSFGVTPVLIKKTTMLNEVLKLVREHCLENKIAKEGEKVIVTVGMPYGKKGDTNMLLVETI
jgi:pyruvate kinase